MLHDQDRIFTNIYGQYDKSLAGAQSRGHWDGTKGIIGIILLPPGKIVDIRTMLSTHVHKEIIDKILCIHCMLGLLGGPAVLST